MHASYVFSIALNTGEISVCVCVCVCVRACVCRCVAADALGGDLRLRRALLAARADRGLRGAAAHGAGPRGRGPGGPGRVRGPAPQSRQVQTHFSPSVKTSVQRGVCWCMLRQTKPVQSDWMRRIILMAMAIYSSYITSYMWCVFVFFSAVTYTS